MPGAERVRKLKIKTAAANLIRLIKPPLSAGVNAQATALIGVTDAMELGGIRK